MALSDFAQNAIPLMFFIATMLVVFGLQPNSELASIWADDTFATPNQIGSTDLNTTLGGSPYATQTSTGLIPDNNPFVNLANSLGIVPKVAHTFQALAGWFVDTFNFIPVEIRWGLGLPLLVIMSIGLVAYLLNASGLSKGGGA